MAIHPTLGWMLAGVFAALGIGSLSRLISLYGKPQDLVSKRVGSLKTWWVIAPILAAAVVLGQFAVAVVFAFAGGLALSEYARLVSSRTGNQDLLRIALSLIPGHYLLICLGNAPAAMLFLPIGALIVLSISQTAVGRAAGFTRAVPAWYWGVDTACLRSIVCSDAFQRSFDSECCCWTGRLVSLSDDPDRIQRHRSGILRPSLG